MQDVQVTLPLGKVLQNRYEIIDLLGRGGFGAVYLVKDQRVRGNLFALKEVIDPDRTERARFTFEGEVLKRLDHPSLPRVYRVFEDEEHSRAYMLMDYIKGPNLETLRLEQPERRFPLDQAFQIMAPIFVAVTYLHSLTPPIIHRDIKPANIIVPGDDEETVLVDFGIAKEYEQDATTTAVRRCSPGFGAPEQYAKGTNPRTDVYGLAATLYALLTGSIPADALYRMTHLGSKDVDPLEPVRQLAPDIPDNVALAIQRALAINNKERTPTVEEFWKELHTPRAGSASAVDAIEDMQTVHTASQNTPVPIEDVKTEIITPGAGSNGKAKKRTAIALLLLSFVLFALVAGMVFGKSLLPGVAAPAQAGPGHATTPGARPVATQNTNGKHPASMPAATAPATTPAATGSPNGATGGNGGNGSKSNYPSLAGVYNGNIIDQGVSPPVTTSMMLTNMRQNGGKISGYFFIGSSLQGNGNFTGSVTTDKKIQFLVAAYQNHLPLSFTGSIKSDGSMAGNYCSYQNGQCDDAGGGFGVWSVKPGMPNSATSLVPTIAPYTKPGIFG